jgi:succinate-semialdehyde dehydrogenase/glutarate-semialdehyde dehydrogenase/succinyl-CoA reductase
MGKLLISGKFVPTRRQFTRRDPATGKILGYVAAAGKTEVDRAVDSAMEAFAAWKSIDVSDREKAILNFCDHLSKNSKDLSKLITMEVGKPLLEAELEIEEAIEFGRWFASETRGYIEDEVIESNARERSFLSFEPLGVIGIIVPWNYPLGLSIWKIFPALIAGNTIVLKPSELSSLVGLEIGKLFQKTGIPDGVVNVVTGSDRTGSCLVSSKAKMIAFTGSVETGRKVASTAGKNLKRAVLELSGNDPFIVCSDADLEEASNGAVWGRFTNCGQVCVSAKRIYVVRDVANQFISKVVEKASLLKIGSGLDRSTDVGPLVDSRHRVKVEIYVKDAVKKGAKVLVGGKKPANLGRGYFYLPTVLLNVDHTMRIMREELFGPVAPIMVVDSIDEAIDLANDSIYGLGASVWTSDVDEGIRIARRLEAGMVWVNDVNVASPKRPWGGTKMSGIGRELSKYGILELVNMKQISAHKSGEPTRSWWFPYAVNARQ